MTMQTLRSTLLIVAMSLSGGLSAPASAEGGDPAALAAAMKDATATLQGGLKASEPQGTPISAKFEIADGKLQLSVYTMKGDGFTEVVADPKTGAIAEAEKITDADDLKAAASQKAAIGKSEGATAHRNRDSGEGQCRVPGSECLSTAAGQQSRGRGDPSAGNDVQEGDGKARLKRRPRVHALTSEED
jgi:hypothetical protein